MDGREGDRVRPLVEEDDWLRTIIEEYDGVRPRDDRVSSIVENDIEEEDRVRLLWRRMTGSCPSRKRQTGSCSCCSYR